MDRAEKSGRARQILKGVPPAKEEIVQMCAQQEEVVVESKKMFVCLCCRINC